MTKRYETITINGKQFMLDTKERMPRGKFLSMDNRSVYDVYKTCSFAKRDIWNHWSSWFNDNCGACRVKSYNSNFFTIEGYVYNYNAHDDYKDLYYVYITASTQKCWKVF